MRINQVSTMNIGMDKPAERPKQTSEFTPIQSSSATQHTINTNGSIDTSGEFSETPDEFSEELVEKSVAQANKTLAKHDRVIERAVHEVTGSIMYTIRDTVTNEVISEFPPRRIQDMIAKMWELAGLFVDEKV